MTSGGAASVVIVSRDRPILLRRACLGVWQQDYRPLELVVVADAHGRAALADLPFADRIVVADNPHPNIAEARNTGFDLAAGRVVAFLDDDAVPEPAWLSRLVAPLADRAVSASTGTVLGRNGFGVQWARETVDACGRSRPSTAGSPRLHGTNCALRAEVLRALGGFDPAYAFFLDETDLTLRLRAAGHGVVHVDDALVVHGFAPSPRRRADRVPRSLFDIGASQAVFLRRHAPPCSHAARLAELRREQAARLDVHLLAGRIEPRDLRRLLRDLDAGIAAGLARALSLLAARHVDNRALRPLIEAPPAPAIVLTGPQRAAAGLRERAAARQPAHAPATLLLMGPGVRRHTMAFTDAGHWEQAGGVRGRSDRSAPVRLRTTRRAREKLEWQRIAHRRGTAT